MKRITIITGHYGSGKTEFSINYALDLMQQGKKTALVDLDIANVYFRSRERQAFLEEAGIEVHSNIYHSDISADLPAIAPSIRKVLENHTYHTVIDAGGNETGAMILNQFARHFLEEEHDMLYVVNANRPETKTLEGAMYHYHRICDESGLRISGLINNTHMLRETEAADVLKGYQLCHEISEKEGIPLIYSCCTEEILIKLKETDAMPVDFNPYRIRLYMRPSWLDR
ncbi:MAG: ATP-binding protein [Eubacteriales bacterium]|nr:ATP-binding protein [Eubacteriales bacterium]